MATWQDVDRVRREFPTATQAELAVQLGCMPQYVSATFRRRGWPMPPRTNGGASVITIRIARETIEARQRPSESLLECAYRIFAAGLEER